MKGDSAARRHLLPLNPDDNLDALILFGCGFVSGLAALALLLIAGLHV